MNSLFFSLLNSLVLMLICNKPLLSQAQLIVTLNNNNTETFAINEIRSIKFVGQTMNMQTSTGSISTWNISDIAYYSFDGVSSISEAEQTIGKLWVYPNPMKEQAKIVFSSNLNQQIRIELLDVLGRPVREIYFGPHSGKQTYTWQADLPKGLYSLLLRSEYGQLTQFILIQ